jgi:hypothetical protein
MEKRLLVFHAILSISNAYKCCPDIIGRVAHFRGCGQRIAIVVIKV